MTGGGCCLALQQQWEQRAAQPTPLQVRCKVGRGSGADSTRGQRRENRRVLIEIVMAAITRQQCILSPPPARCSKKEELDNVLPLKLKEKLQRRVDSQIFIGIVLFFEKK